ncbi:glycosyltransferase family 2 protein [Mammaliicoccus sciuri]|uniref:glycosyltransferase family 2 protein n=2 Tax=Mammaliicoccus sciuri TaxID=1296 RepID=UPI002175309C|nr:glycosyltransferase family 2 protein [Mammaliicoccus sciuri]MCY1025189.1 glycosyltransferase family 2 protein [Mammaliicoccus sciuri]MEB5569091.1 glycosyltransferase family 2 protein [Mammaliicoccus sciuri]MEB8373727.1 glycosyltransferase family 2 protein [Mammaliicoccus sciuri]
MIIIVYVVTLILTICTMLSGALMYFRRCKINPSHMEASKTPVSLIIPARNEAKNLPNLLKRVANHKDIEIIVMDDDSTDQTCAIAEQYGAHVYKVSKHATWKGKSHACWEGSQVASHNMLLFVDADVQFSSLDSIWQIVNQYKLQQYRGLLSIQPYHMIERLYENASALFNVMTIVGMNTFSITKSKYDDQMAFGPVILTNKQDYELTQGHFNAKDSIIEGFAISKSYHQHALPVELYEGQGVVNFRMYPQGYKSLIEGWSKHIALGAQVTKQSTLALIVLWLIGTVTSTIMVIISLWLNPIFIALALMVYVLYAFQHYIILKRTGNFHILVSVCHPLMFMNFMMIFMKSWFDVHVFKIIQWKGRKINL